MTNLGPHELVLAVARELGESISALKDKADDLAEAESAAFKAAREPEKADASERIQEREQSDDEAGDRPRDVAEAAKPLDEAEKADASERTEEREQSDDEAGARPPDVAEAAQALAQALANEPSLPDLVTFAGFLGGTIDHKWDGQQAATWQLLYLDARLQTWLIVPDDDIVVAHRMYDETAPFKARDVIWVRSRASVNQGSGSLSAEARFLTGEFTRAADVEAPPSGATFAPATGVFCETRDPFGCHRKSQ